MSFRLPKLISLDEFDRDHVVKIAPVPEGVDRPFWSVMIPTFNRPEYLKQTLESVLVQDPGPQEMFERNSCSA